MKQQYIENCKLIHDKGILSQNGVLEDYSYYPIEEELDRVFTFYTETLSLNQEYGISPAILFYENNNKINAVASKQNGYYVIGIYLGTIVYLEEIFKNKNNLIKDAGIKEFIKFEKKSGISINELMYQQALHFTFYHEMGHLIQKSNFLETQLFENLSATTAFDLKKHILELDADRFASLNVSAHVVQYAKNTFKDKLTEEDLEKILVIICSSALFYVLSFQSENSSIYYEEKSHPHPIIRITLIIFHVVSYALQFFESEGHKFNLQSKTIVNNCLKFSIDISDKIMPKDLITKYQSIIPAESDKITEYIMKAESFLEKDGSLASNKWNEIAKTKNN
ncbi:MAG TPA: hypothetical protein VNX01_13455 [Bacteroidia bacterium]|jgi:hypothetical protein|nr:hypothetical protein [Bacteroidia bacterium]